MDERALAVAPQTAIRNISTTPRASNDPSDGQSAVSAVAPFDAFRWMPNAPIGRISAQPVGAEREEARAVAWLLSCSAHCRAFEEACEAAKTIAYAAHLRREAPVAEFLYKSLALRATGLVHISEVERALGCTWGGVDVEINGFAQRMDPYFWKMLETMVRDSVVEYLQRLDAAICNLDGMCPMQCDANTSEAMEQAKRAVTHSLSKELLNRDATPASTAALLLRLQQQHQPTHERDAKRVLREQIRGIRALGSVAAAPAEELDERMQDADSSLRSLILFAPRALREQFEDRRISLLELSTVFATQSNGLLDARTTVPPASTGVRVTVMARWLERHRHAVAEACVSAIATLQQALNRGSLSPEWAHVNLCIGDPSGARYPKRGAVAPWRSPEHLGPSATGGRVIVATLQNGTALRVARFFKLLVQQARLGLLPSVSMRADWVLPIVTRFTAEHEVAYGQLVDMKLRPMAAACEIPWPGDAPRVRHIHKRSVPSPSPSDVESVQSAEFATAVAAPAFTSPAQQRAGWVHPKLLRDHAILHALCMCLFARQSARSVRVSLDEIVTQVRALAVSFREQSTSSLTQSVRHVCMEIIKRAKVQAAADDLSCTMEFNSVRDRSTDGKVGGVVCDGAGTRHLLHFATSVVQQMRFNSEAYCSVWHSTRSAQSRAAALVRQSGKKAKTRDGTPARTLQ